MLTHNFLMRRCFYVCMRMHMHVCTCVCACVCICVCTCACAHVCICMCMCTCASVCACACMRRWECVCVRLCVCCMHCYTRKQLYMLDLLKSLELGPLLHAGDRPVFSPRRLFPPLLSGHCSHHSITCFKLLEKLDRNVSVSCLNV